MNDPWRNLGVSVVLTTAQDYAKLLRQRDRIVQSNFRKDHVARLNEINYRIYAMEKLLNSHYFGMICPGYDTTKLADMVREKYRTISMRTTRRTYMDGDKRRAGDGYVKKTNPKKRGRRATHGDWAW